MRDDNGRWWERSYPRSLLALLTHLVGTAIVFTAILVLAWGMSYLVAWLHAVHPFPPETYRFLAVVKRWLVYVDVAVSAAALLYNTVQFIRRTWEAK
jgi:hypothetical protein